MAASELGDQWTGNPVFSWLVSDKGKSEGASYFFRYWIDGERKAVGRLACGSAVALLVFERVPKALEASG